MKFQATQSFKEAYPLAFDLSDIDGHNAIYIVPDDLIEKQEMHLAIKNISSEQLYLEHLSSDPNTTPTANNCHFELRFRLGILSKGSLGQHHHPAITGPRLKIKNSKQKENSQSGNWSISSPVVQGAGTANGWVSIYIGRYGDNGDWPLDQNSGLPFVITQLSAAEGEEGTRNTRVMLIPKRVHKKLPTGNPANPYQTIPMTEECEQVVKVINHNGVPFMPVHFGFRGANTILNDGQANLSVVDNSLPNVLSFRLANNSSKQTIKFKKNSRIKFHFATEFPRELQTIKDGTVQNFETMKFSIIDAKKANPIPSATEAESGDQLFWALDWEALQDASHTEIPPKGYIDFQLDISDFLTTHRTGVEFLLLSYENIQGYWDGHLQAPIEITPLKFTKEEIKGQKWVVANPGDHPIIITDSNATIPMDNLDANTRLHINSNVKIEKGDLTLTKGSIKTSEGNVKVDNGDVHVVEGNVKVENGDVNVVEGDVHVIKGNVELDDGYVYLTDGYAKIQKGDFITHDGAVIASRLWNTAGVFSSTGTKNDHENPTLKVNNMSGTTAIQVEKGDVTLKNGALYASKIKPIGEEVNVEGTLHVSNGQLYGRNENKNAVSFANNSYFEATLILENEYENKQKNYGLAIRIMKGDLQLVDGQIKVNSESGDKTAGRFINNSSWVPTLKLTNGSVGGPALKVSGRAFKNNGDTSWDIDSDRRLKQNIEAYPEGLDCIKQIKPVWYRYKDIEGHSSHQRNVGIIAQELQGVAPHMVGETKGESGETYLSTNTSAMSFMLVNAVKELSAELDSVKAEMKAMREEMRKLNNV